jgi:hypothetical protein
MTSADDLGLTRSDVSWAEAVSMTGVCLLHQRQEKEKRKKKTLTVR